MRRYHTSGNKLKPQVLIQPNIGLDGDERSSVVEILNTILADEAVLAMKIRSVKWHVGGPGFLDIQALFDQQYQHLNRVSDEIAERVRILDGTVMSSFGEYLQSTRLLEQSGELPDLLEILADHEALVRFLREDARKCIEEFEDHGTYSLLVKFISFHEKMAWVLRSYIQPE